jgi:UDP-N-acetylglucosamine acyltransferase
MEIHPTAIVDKNAVLGQNVRIGPYTIIGGSVIIGEGTEVGSHVVIEGTTSIGKGNRIFPFVTLGTPPQDVGYRGEDTRLIIGNDNIIREYSTMHRATTKEEWKTQVGSRNYFMAYSHVAHDCRVGDSVILANSVNLGGHAKVGDYASIGGLSAVHQFVRVGAYAFIGGMTAVDRDIPPFMLAAGNRAKLYGPNRKGLSRQGFTGEDAEGLKAAYRIIWRESKTFEEGISRVRNELRPSMLIELLLAFFEKTKRGIIR